MINKRWVEIAVGSFVVISLAAMVMLAMRVSNLSAFSTDGVYEIEARFHNVGGLKVRAPVTMAGVHIGRVAAIELDSQRFDAVVKLAIDDKFNHIPLDTSAAVFTAGLLGEQYVALEPGGDEKFLKQGDRIRIAQSAMVMEQILGQFIFNAAAGDKENKK
ncbi:MAG: outer membrane lipid asymmetry maintenance protein MlaD [Gammaproteobacteria bacterium]|nr:outer membrane lipid asymmetry maintenance protein MlaD [Gammaproteobacteria bacterium]